MITIIDTSATHSFIFLDCAKRLNFKLYYMVGSMFIDTLANSSVTTLLACLKCPLTIYGKIFCDGFSLSTVEST